MNLRYFNTWHSLRAKRTTFCRNDEQSFDSLQCSDHSVKHRFLQTFPRFPPKNLRNQGITRVKVRYEFFLYSITFEQMSEVQKLEIGWKFRKQKNICREFSSYKQHANLYNEFLG